MDWFSAPDYRLARFALERGLGLVYLIAFLVALNQFPALLGEHGLLPAPALPPPTPASARRRACSTSTTPTASCARSAVVGIVLSAAVVAGLPQAGPLWLPMLVWLVALGAVSLDRQHRPAVLRRSAGSPSCSRRGSSRSSSGNARTAPPFPVLLLFRWLAFRVELGAGLIKLRGDSCWRDLTCMDYHHETQPMPEPAELVLPSAAARAAPRRGGGQLRGPARRADPAVPAAADRGRSAALLMLGHPGLPGAERQLRLAQLADHGGRDLPRCRTPFSGGCCRAGGADPRPRRRPGSSAPSCGDRAGRRAELLARRATCFARRQLMNCAVQPAPPGRHLRRVRQHHPASATR